MKHWWDYVDGKMTRESAIAGFEKYSASTKAKLKRVSFTFDNEKLDDFISCIEKNGLIRVDYYNFGNIENLKDTNIDKSHPAWLGDLRFFNTHTFLELHTATRDYSWERKGKAEDFNLRNDSYRKKWPDWTSHKMTVPEIEEVYDVDIITLNDTIANRIIESYQRVSSMMKALE